MLNYAIDPALLTARIPRGTVLDLHDDRGWVSVVGFIFLDTRVMGVPVPGHRDFEELNLRFYVRRDVPDPARGVEFRRGVAFVKELVPRWAIATIARLVYHEPYEAVSMRHTILRADGVPNRAINAEAALSVGDSVSYEFQLRKEWGEVRGTVASEAGPSVPGSHAHFITEHYWGYTACPDAATAEYEVVHPEWAVHEVKDAALTGDLEALYGPELGRALSRPPDSAFIAVGSEIAVHRGSRVA